MRKNTLFYLAVIGLLLMGMNILKWLFTAFFIVESGASMIMLVEPSWVYLGEFVFVAIMMLIIILYVVKKL